MKLAKVIQHMGAAAAELEPALNDREVDRFAIDSRDVQAGSLFFALSQPDYKNNGFNGDFDDATKFVRSAFENGAVAAVVRTDRFDVNQADLAEFADRIIQVEDVIRAFQNLAHGVYLEWNKPVVAITGSAGKTTAKEFTAHVLESSGRRVLRNVKNYNNGLGHPLTVLGLAEDPSYDLAVLEMGMSTPMNEIGRLCKITPPDLAVEIVSPSDTAVELEVKVHDYLRNGALRVWVVYPDSRRVAVHRPDGTARWYSEDAAIEDEGLLPGFSLPLREIFGL